jgi:hypothetical protein
MATSTETEVELKINNVSSNEVLEQMEKDGFIEPYSIYVTPDGDDAPSGGSKVIWEVWE